MSKVLIVNFSQSFGLLHQSMTELFTPIDWAILCGISRQHAILYRQLWARVCQLGLLVLPSATFASVFTQGGIEKNASYWNAIELSLGNMSVNYQFNTLSNDKLYVDAMYQHPESINSLRFILRILSQITYKLGLVYHYNIGIFDIYELKQHINFIKTKSDYGFAMIPQLLYDAALNSHSDNRSDLIKLVTDVYSQPWHISDIYSYNTSKLKLIYDTFQALRIKTVPMDKSLLISIYNMAIRYHGDNFHTQLYELTRQLKIFGFWEVPFSLSYHYSSISSLNAYWKMNIQKELGITW